MTPATTAPPLPWYDPRRIALVLAIGCAACGVAFLAYSLTTRAYGPVEAEMVYQASRIQHGYPLYIDPAAGAWEDGAPPSRYYVLYTPVWPWILAHVSPASVLGIRTVGRVVNALLLLLTLGLVTRASSRANRVGVAAGACLAIGLELLVREAGLANADMPAVALSTLGLLRMNKKGGLDALAVALLVAAPLVKPSVLGGVSGAVLAHLVVHRKSGWRRLVSPFAGGAVGLALVAWFHVWSGGVWLDHIVRGTGQTISFERWTQEFGSRAVVLGAPHLVVLAIAVRRRTTLLATVPLAASTAWTIFSMAKHGSGTQYWLEPTMAALIVLGAMPAPAVQRRIPLAAWLGVAFAIVVGVASIPSFARAPAEARGWRDVVRDIRDACPLAKGEVLMANDVRLELEIDGRVIVPCWQNSYLVRTGKFPLDAWRGDLARPEVRWFVHGTDYLAPVPEKIEGVTEVSAYRKELKDAVEESFVLDREVGGLLVFRRR